MESRISGMTGIVTKPIPIPNIANPINVKNPGFSKIFNFSVPDTITPIV